MSYPNVADLSSAQTSFDAGTYAASGRVAVIIKSTEGTGYHFAEGDAWEAQAEAAGLVVGRYHWCGSSMKGTIQPPGVEGQYFLDKTGMWKPGRFAAGDMENPLHGPPLYGMSAGTAAQWLDAFLDYIFVHGQWPGLGYSFSGSGVIQLIKHQKWPASYPVLTVAGAAMHQFTDRGSVPGVGSCDDSHCFIDLKLFSGMIQPVRRTVVVAGRQPVVY